MAFWFNDRKGRQFRVDGTYSGWFEVLIGIRDNNRKLVRGMKWNRWGRIEKGTWGLDDEFKTKHIFREGTIIDGKWTYSGKMTYYPRLANIHVEEGTKEYKDEESHVIMEGKYGYSEHVKSVVVLFASLPCVFACLWRGGGGEGGGEREVSATPKEATESLLG